LRSESTTQGAKPPKEKLAGAQPKEIPVAPAVAPMDELAVDLKADL